MILTGDRHIKTNALELRSVLDCGACYVCVLGGHRRGEELASMVVRGLPRVDAIAAAAPRPLLMRIAQSGITIWLDGEWTPAKAQHANLAWWRRRDYHL